MNAKFYTIAAFMKAGLDVSLALFAPNWKLSLMFVAFAVSDVATGLM